jgi:hypothetical protein
MAHSPVTTGNLIHVHMIFVTRNFFRKKDHLVTRHSVFPEVETDCSYLLPLSNHALKVSVPSSFSVLFTDIVHRKLLDGLISGQYATVSFSLDTLFHMNVRGPISHRNEEHPVMTSITCQAGGRSTFL